MGHAQGALQHDREFVEFRALAGLDPSAWAAHASDAEPVFGGVNAADKLFDDFGFVTGGGDARRRWNKCGHKLAGILLRQD
jgi:hypothetical protein